MYLITFYLFFHRTYLYLALCPIPTHLVVLSTHLVGKLWPGTAAHVCNPSYMGGEDGASFVSSGKKLMRPISIKKLGVVVHTCGPSNTGGCR
jgi:hypothetical protein